MGTGKKEANRKVREGKTGDGMGNVKVKGENFYRTAKKIKTLNMFKDGKPQRNAQGDITKAASYQSREKPVARVEPNRKWFNATRVISQDALESFRSAVQAQAQDPTVYLMRQNKLPMSLINDKPNTNGLKEHAAKIAVESQPFTDTFGPKAQRKRPKLDFSSVEDLAARTGTMHDTYLDRLEQARLLSGNSGALDAEDGEGTLTTARESIFSKGQSKRIWNELYKVIDSSDVILHVLDARDPLGTRCRSVEKYLREEAPHKHLVFVLNKVDLVPSRVAAAWVRALSTEFPTLAFHASINNSFGKGSLIQILRQFSSLHSDRKQISVGLIGYPNTGKSSIINTLRKKKVCTVAPVAGETKVWQYVTLMKRIYLIDCPGIVPPNNNDTDDELLLRGSIRVENVEYPAQYIDAVLSRVQPKHLQRTYEIKGYNNSVEFLEMLARKGGRLLKGGEPDLDGCAKMVLNDWIRGKVPWFTPPPMPEGEQGEKTEGVEGRKGRLGEMGKKRKREDEGESVAATGDTAADAESTEDDVSQDEDDNEFEGFDEEDLQLELQAEEDDEDSEGSAGDDGDAKTIVAEEESDEDVELEVQAISEALAKAKKQRRK
ncbi:nucleolar GTP-binding protein [Delitschia confertaspora ATCC 74209]|uniref:Nucleolar GTP-binding protein 2 n=1 Tax=Delitschia confertaspora ATCC 74209 TaxID=1513339 RepID=A0A9P4JL54_9PLEO|nr:nucleolar GTP-binding protein [Delitschia confertaspora ATCC 74209]